MNVWSLVDKKWCVSILILHSSDPPVFKGVGPLKRGVGLEPPYKL